MRSIILRERSRRPSEQRNDFIDGASELFAELAGVVRPACVAVAINNRGPNNSDTARSVKTVAVHMVFPFSWQMQFGRNLGAKPGQDEPKSGMLGE